MDDDSCAFLAAFQPAGSADALVEALEHESPFCVAAAAAALGLVGKAMRGGQAAIEASGAIPALVRVIKKKLPAQRVEGQMAMYRRSEPGLCASRRVRHGFQTCLSGFPHLWTVSPFCACVLKVLLSVHPPMLPVPDYYVYTVHILCVPIQLLFHMYTS